MTSNIVSRVPPVSFCLTDNFIFLIFSLTKSDLLSFFGGMTMRFHHTCISVTDLETSLRFYRAILGFKVVRQVPKISGPAFEAMDVLPAGSSCRTVLLDTGDGSHIQLSQYSPKGKLPRPDSNQCDIGLIHIGFRVTQIEKLYQELCQKGVKLNCSVEYPEEGLKEFSLDDPDGVRLEFLEFSKEWEKV